MRKLLTVTIITTSVVSSGVCQLSGRKIDGRLAAVPPKIDGVLDDEVWRTAPIADGFTELFSAAPAEDKTEARICYDKDAMYVAFHCFDQHPDQLIGREIRPGTDLTGEDFVVFRVDAFHSNSDGQINRFHVSVLGTQNDEIAGGRAAKREWRGQWDAAAKKLSDGYAVEMRIPWKVIGHPAGGKHDVTVNFVRLHGRTKQKTMWSNTTSAERPELNGVCLGVDIPGSDSKPKPSYLIYGLGDENWDRRVTSFDAGLDVRLPITQSFTAVGSVNPDFKNVEQAIQGLDFSRGERFLGDTRPFFAEGSQQFQPTFEFAVGRMFYSRRISDFDFGAKAYGRLNANDGLAALTTHGADDETNAAIVASHSFGPERSFSLFGTSQSSVFRDDLVLGGTIHYRMGNYSFHGELMEEQDRNFASSAYDVSAWYQVPKLLSILMWSEIEPDFNPALGLVQINDRRGGIFYTEFQDSYRTGTFSGAHGELFATHYRHFDGSPDEDSVGADYQLNTFSDQQIQLSAEYSEFNRVVHRTAGFGYVFGRTNRFQKYGAGMEIGERAGLPYRLAKLVASQRLFKKLDLSMSYAGLDFGGKFDQLILTAGWEFDAKRSVTGRLVRQGDKTNWYAAFRSSGFTGNEVFVIVGDPNSLEFTPRVAIKLVWPF